MRAFSDKRYDYYELTCDMGWNEKREEFLLPAGTIFVHDTDDHVNGSIAQGCLKNCWIPTGNTYGKLSGGTVILHAYFKNTTMFRLIQEKETDEKQILNEITEIEQKLEKLRKMITPKSVQEWVIVQRNIFYGNGGERVGIEEILNESIDIQLRGTSVASLKRQIVGEVVHKILDTAPKYGDPEDEGYYTEYDKLKNHIARLVADKIYETMVNDEEVTRRVDEACKNAEKTISRRMNKELTNILKEGSKA